MQVAFLLFIYGRLPRFCQISQIEVSNMRLVAP